MGVDFLDCEVGISGWPDVFEGLSKNSERKALGNGLTLEYHEFDHDRQTNTARTCSYTWRLNTPWGDYKLFFLVLSRKVKRGCVNVWHRIEITGSGCRLVGVGKILEYAETLGVKVKAVKDLHLCADFLTPYDAQQNVLRSCLEIRAKKAQSGRTFDHRGALETVEIGDYSSERNTYRFIRVYDKDADTQVKRKEGIYPTVPLLRRTRFEVDLRPDKAKHFKPIWLLDSEKIRDVFAYELRFYLPDPQEKIPSSWGDFRKVGINPAVPGTYHRAGTRRLSDKARVDWAQCRSFMRKLFERGATLKDLLPNVVAEYRNHLSKRNESGADALAMTAKRRHDKE